MKKYFPDSKLFFPSRLYKTPTSYENIVIVLSMWGLVIRILKIFPEDYGQDPLTVKEWNLVKFHNGKP